MVKDARSFLLCRKRPIWEVYMRSKGIWVTLVVSLLLALSAVPLTAAGAKNGGGVDGDGNKIFDSLDRALGRAGAGDRVGVIALFSGGTSRGKAAEAANDL